MLFLRSLLFNTVFFFWTAFVSVALVWALLLPRATMVQMITRFLASIAWLERHLIGLKYEVRGREHLPREGAYILAAKHQSAWETLKLHLLVADPAAVLKRELMWIPTWGWYATKSHMIPVDRGARGKALASLVEGARRARAEGRPIIIFPQGTRTAPGVHRSYRIGVGVLYEKLDLPIVPMALNSGVFWPRRGFIKRPGTITVEFLPPIPPGRPRHEAMAELEARLEAASDRLAIQAGGPATQRPLPDPVLPVDQPAS